MPNWVVLKEDFIVCPHSLHEYKWVSAIVSMFKWISLWLTWSKKHKRHSRIEKTMGLASNLLSHESFVFMIFDKEQKDNGQDHWLWMVKENDEENQTIGWLGMW